MLADAQHRLPADRFTLAVRWVGAPWMLDSSQRQVILGASLAGFEGFAAARALAHMDIHDLEGDSAAGRRWADTVLAALPAAERMLGKSNPYIPMVRAMVQSRLGRHDSALVSAAAALRLSDADRIGTSDPGLRIGVAQILMRAGRKDEAVARLEEALRVQYLVSAAWLAIDPDVGAVARASGVRPARGAALTLWWLTLGSSRRRLVHAVEDSLRRVSAAVLAHLLEHSARRSLEVRRPWAHGLSDPSSGLRAATAGSAIL